MKKLNKLTNKIKTNDVFYLYETFSWNDNLSELIEGMGVTNDKKEALGMATSGIILTVKVENIEIVNLGEIIINNTDNYTFKK